MKSENNEKIAAEENANRHLEDIATDFLNEKCSMVPESQLSNNMMRFFTSEISLLITVCTELREKLNGKTGKYTGYLRYTPEHLVKMKLEKVAITTEENTQEELAKPLGRELFDICMRLCDECANLRRQIEFTIHD